MQVRFLPGALRHPDSGAVRALGDNGCAVRYPPPHGFNPDPAQGDL
jgi:hypothetical protein